MEDEKDAFDALDALEKEAKEYDKVQFHPQTLPPLPPTNPSVQDKEIERILSAFRLDSYAVLDLLPGCPDSDIKLHYRKKSLLIHPDKTSNARAPEAFDRLKKAESELMDEKRRAKLDEAISDARMLLMREHKWTPDSPEVRDESFKVMWREKTKAVLIDNEARRQRQLKAQMQEEGRQQRKEDAEIEERKRKRDHEKAWEDTREKRIGSWRDFQKGGKPTATEGGEKKKKKKLKVLG
ncbi:DnaJ-domain-containing protein [Patellaria atrata CBS 101060]|uniref:DnaJ-domain-containing protein n=1 Tax=Patellaria atrata CBS 101060 TaxID=1346257 RepID=A0A9P4VSP3_9PEZI|nr:DnaJ-domain-containing protein [Patellaria atrata CBS 101060]